jgi:hypothetical protein
MHPPSSRAAVATPKMPPNAEEPGHRLRSLLRPRYPERRATMTLWSFPTTTYSHSGRTRSDPRATSLFATELLLQRREMGQTTPDTSTTTRTREQDVGELSPFTIESDRETGRVVTQTLGGSRLGTDFKGVSQPFEVSTPEFVQDLAANHFETACSTRRTSTDAKDTRPEMVSAHVSLHRVTLNACEASPTSLFRATPSSGSCRPTTATTTASLSREASRRSVRPRQPVRCGRCRPLARPPSTRHRE